MAQNPVFPYNPPPQQYMAPTLPSAEDQKKLIKDYIRYSLGDQMVDIDLDKEHYDLAISYAMQKYRQRSANSVEESYAFMELIKDQTDYYLPLETISVRQILRRGIGSVTGTAASQFEPFASGYLNTYMLTAGKVGGLASYELFTEYQSLAMRMFGGHIQYTFDPVSKKLVISRKVPDGGEVVLLWVYNYRTDQAILNSYSSFPWVQDYAYAKAKFMLGEARSKYQSLAGPQGGTSLNGSELKAEAKEEMAKLEEDIKNYQDMSNGSMPPSFLIG
jgi:hypothetical protein